MVCVYMCVLCVYWCGGWMTESMDQDRTNDFGQHNNKTAFLGFIDI